MRFVVETWAPEYSTGLGAGAVMEPTAADVDVDVERAAGAWTAIVPDGSATPAPCVHVIDGVRRIDARVWITGDDGRTTMGVCASYAAGVARCDTAASIDRIEVRRALLAPAGASRIDTRAGSYLPVAATSDDEDALSLALQERMGQLEIEVAHAVRIDGGTHAELVVVDGPLSGRQNVPGAVGYVKTHRVRYLPEEQQAVVATLAAGQRTPLFLTRSSWSRFSWYLRLPGPAGHPWAGIVRCEAAADRSLDDARRLADTTAVTLPRYASAPHKDPRAPQNLYPIAALERELRRRLGDPATLERALRIAARTVA